MQATRRPGTALQLSAAVVSGRQFLSMVVQAHSVAECTVPAGAPSLIDTTLSGVHELSCLLHSYAPDW